MVPPLPLNVYNFDGIQRYGCIQRNPPIISINAFPSRADVYVFSKSDLFKEVLYCFLKPILFVCKSTALYIEQSSLVVVQKYLFSRKSMLF